jgi:FtsP/CotA-like multicopper oxidase with cupredoxin domain
MSDDFAGPPEQESLPSPHCCIGLRPSHRARTMRSIQVLTALALSAPILGFAGHRGPAAPPEAKPNPNVERAGTLKNGVLAVSLDAAVATWHLDGPKHPARPIAAFSERGKAPLMPGPLVRVPLGTSIQFTVHNSLAAPLTFTVPAMIRGAADPFQLDSITVAPNATGSLTIRASKAGNYTYLASTPSKASKELIVTGALIGALVVDSAGESTKPHDRIFMLQMTPDSATEASTDTTPLIGDPRSRFVFTINGRSWPRTERIQATVGDSMHWRIINGSSDIHPMHLHGFYYRVDSFNGPFAARDGQGQPGRMVVTERLSPFSGMSMTWSPNRAGNWIFHCHFALHLMPDSISAEPDMHGMMGMVGLIMGITVADRPGVTLAAAPMPMRRLRLVAVADSGYADSVASLRFRLEERGRWTEEKVAHSPPIELTRGEPVTITVVNHLREGTSVHWHGIELESYNDGVAGVSGAGKQIAPMIAPGDSFVARMTPPRSGTFMYHAHMNEVHQQEGGLAGALIVRDPNTARNADDHAFFLKGSRDINATSPLEIGGSANPDTIVLHAGKPARLRFMSLAVVNPNATVSLTAHRDSVRRLNGPDADVVQWKPVAKDGFDLPATARVERRAQQIVSMGETYDYEYTPKAPGLLRMEVRSAGPRGVLLVRVPIKVE